MVHQYFDNHDNFASMMGVPRRAVRTYTPLPAKVRLQRWLQRVFPNSAFMRESGNCRTECKLKASIAKALGLSDNIVVIDSEGNLWHASRETPIAVYVHGS